MMKKFRAGNRVVAGLFFTGTKHEARGARCEKERHSSKTKDLLNADLRRKAGLNKNIMFWLRFDQRSS
jgi:hypothetical protein